MREGCDWRWRRLRVGLRRRLVFLALLELVMRLGLEKHSLEGGSLEGGLLEASR